VPRILFEQTADFTLGVWELEEDEARLADLAGWTDAPPHTNALRRREFLAVRALAVEMDIDPTRIDYLPSGKPFLMDGGHSLSISHTKKFVGLVLSDHPTIGLDLEYLSDRIQRIKDKFMHPDEIAEWNRTCPPERDVEGLLLHWCAKEALFKAVPEEGIDFKQELRIEGLQAPQTTGRFRGCFTRTGNWFEIDYRIFPEFVLTCSFSVESTES
jgi:4'-phosphopantetheinyl transferase EntD